MIDLTNPIRHANSVDFVLDQYEFGQEDYVPHQNPCVSGDLEKRISQSVPHRRAEHQNET